MDYLRILFETAGFAKVETFIASGNVIFDTRSKNTKALEQKIERHLQKMLGYEVRTFVRAVSELVAVANYKPFSETELNADGNTLYVGFTTEPSSEGKRKLLSLSSATDEFAVHGCEVYWLSRTSFREATVSGALLEKTLGARMTLRNVNTVRRLAAKYS
jgi:uncharacterized protein (DUF1697 family)